MGIEWAVETLAGEILLTSMDRDGTKSGFDLGLTKKFVLWAFQLLHQNR